MPSRNMQIDIKKVSASLDCFAPGAENKREVLESNYD